MHIHERAASPKNMPLPWQSLRGRHTFFAQQQRSQSFAECSHSTTGDHRAAALVVPADGGGLATDTSDPANRSSRTLPHDRRGRKYSLIRRAGKPVTGLELGMDSLDFAPAVDGGKVRRPSPSAHPGKRESGSFAKYWIPIRGLFLNIG